MKREFWRKGVIVLLVLFFAAGGFTNLFPPAAMAGDYARWGYPEWFHYVTGVLELSAAALIVWQPMRWAGLLLAFSVMCGALATLLVHHEFLHALAPVTVMAVLAVAVWLSQDVRQRIAGFYKRGI